MGNNLDISNYMWNLQDRYNDVELSGITTGMLPYVTYVLDWIFPINIRSIAKRETCDLHF